MKTLSDETITTRIGRQAPPRTAQLTKSGPRRGGRRPPMTEVATVIDTEQRIAALAKIMMSVDLDDATGPSSPSSLRATDETARLDLQLDRIVAELAIAQPPRNVLYAPRRTTAAVPLPRDPVARRPLWRAPVPDQPAVAPARQVSRGTTPPPLPGASHPVQRFEGPRQAAPARPPAMTGLSGCELLKAIGLVLAVAAATFAALLFAAQPGEQPAAPHQLPAISAPLRQPPPTHPLPATTKHR